MPLIASAPAARRSAPRAIARPTFRQIVLLAIALRLIALAIPAIAHPDEVFQYLETAHRLLFGQGVVTWEWRYGMRGWLLPMLVAAPMAAGAWLAPQSALYLTLPKLMMAIASLTTVWTAWRLGERLSATHAVFAAFVAAIWYEFIFFAPHVLSDTASIACILPAAVLLIERERRTAARLATAAALLALAATIRFQHLPAIAVLLLATCGRDLRATWRPLLLGGIGGLLPSALCDLAMGATPFSWLLVNIRLNFVENRAAGYGASGPFGFLPLIWPRWALWSAPLLMLAAIGARRYPALAWTAVANLVFHMAIAHKEYRFIFLSASVVVLLAAIGTVDAAERIAARRGETVRQRLGFFAVAWLLASLSLAFGGFREQWIQAEPELEAFARLRADPALCGVAAYRIDYFRLGGYAYLHRDVPIEVYPQDTFADPRATFARYGSAVNTVLTQPRYAHELPAGYSVMGCGGSDGPATMTMCLYRRPGACRPSGAADRFTMSRTLASIDR